MKDGRTLSRKAEHAFVGAIVGYRRHDDDRRDGDRRGGGTRGGGGRADTGGDRRDKGYHSNQVLVDLGALDLRTYIHWKKKTANRRRIRSEPYAHLSGGLRRVLKAHPNNPGKCGH